MKAPFVVSSTAISVILLIALLISQKTNHDLQKQLRLQTSQILSLQSQLADKNNSAKTAQIEQQIALDNQNALDAIAGIYEFERPYSGRVEAFDFRSDGSVLHYYYYANHPEMFNGKKNLAWTFNNGSISVQNINGKFRPEGSDLIDADGNRWIRVH